MSTVYAESLMLTVDEINDLVARDGKPEETLENVVQLVAKRFKTDVCSVYLLQPDRENLLLAATVGLSQSCVGKLVMSIREGLVGLVAENVQTLAVEVAEKHERYKYIPDAEEDAYQSFAGVPLSDHGVLQGVLVVQTVATRKFTPEEMQRLEETADALGPIMSEVRRLEHFIVPAHERLWHIARNLWWSWDHDGVALLRDLDPVRWRELGHNPTAMLAEISLDKLEQRAGQMVLHSQINNVYHRLQEYLEASGTWAGTHAALLEAMPVAYFSAEFGLHESMPIYSGGLGVLAGDHVKSASDLGLPLIGVGLFYDQGYFHQRLDQKGWQQEDYTNVDVSKLPLELALDANGDPINICIETRTGAIQAKVWRAKVGRCTLLLLDSDVEGNAPEDRELTARLYGGDTRIRIRQELLLGVGGVRALAALGITPGVVHLNEGHSAYATLELTRQRMQDEGVDYAEAAKRVTRQTVFTTHTPVPAGHDRFAPDLVEEHLGPLRDALGVSFDQLMGLGRIDPDNPTETFCMTVLALKLSRCANGVSSLHGHVSRDMWASLWPHRTHEQIPIGHITNGIHVHSWLAPQMHELFNRRLNADWHRACGDPRTWSKISKIDDSELWETHLTLKARLVSFVRRRVVEDAKRRGTPERQLKVLARVHSPDALTVGFARRFATYKRGNLLFSDLDRLAKLINDQQRPLQVVFAGKAHPRDEAGKKVLQEIAEFTSDMRFQGRIVFVEDYDINVGRHLVQGVDVWLNNPRRPLEASGTSGQKVVLNGGLNLSILDGWWAEAYDGMNGFAIGVGRSHTDVKVQDVRDAESLYSTLSDKVIPLYYDRDDRGLPRQWVAQVKHAMRTLGWRFSADRMVMDYVTHCYLPAAGGN